MYMYIRIYIYIYYIYRYLYPRKAGLVLQKSMPSMLRLTHITIPFPSMRHSLDDAGVIYIYINILFYMFRMSGCRCSPRRPIPMPRDGDDTDQRAEPVATSVQLQGLLSVSCEDCSSFLHLYRWDVETIFFTPEWPSLMIEVLMEVNLMMMFRILLSPSEVTNCMKPKK